jgi:hypothetical protein
MENNVVNTEEKFVFSSRLKMITIAMMAIGIIALIYGIFTSENKYQLWANLHLNNFYFIALAIGGVFFIAAHIIGQAGWHTAVQRIPDAMGTYLPVGGVLLLVTFIFGLKHIFHHWTDMEHADAIILGKKAYLNIPFFYIRTVIYLGAWVALSRALRKVSIQSDFDADIKHYNKQRTLAGLFLVVFAITSSTSAWDWLMSIDAHWFSTLYGWYVLAGTLVSSTAIIILLLLVVRSMGFMQHVNSEHIHDLGKYLFGFSVFWMYLWFSQYMLIWYGNLPEETVYFIQRLKQYETIFFVNLIINFAVPFLALMTRNSKRINWILGAVAAILFVGHWIDYYLAIFPGMIGESISIGFFEIGLTIGYLGLFAFVVFRSLTKAALVPKNHPFFKESLHYHTQY